MTADEDVVGARLGRRDDGHPVGRQRTFTDCIVSHTGRYAAEANEQFIEACFFGADGNSYGLPQFRVELKCQSIPLCLIMGQIPQQPYVSIVRSFLFDVFNNHRLALKQALLIVGPEAATHLL